MPSIVMKEHIDKAEALLREKPRLTGCTSYVSRNLSIGYNAAADVLNCLVERGVISEPDGKSERHWVGATAKPEEGK